MATESRSPPPGAAPTRGIPECGISGIILSVMAFLTSLHALADLPGHNPVPGGIAVIPLETATDDKPVVKFGERPVHVARDQGGWSAVVGLPCDILPGNYIVTVSGGQQDHTSVELGILPHSPRLPDPDAGDGGGHVQGRSPTVTLPRGVSARSVVNIAMFSSIDYDHALAAGMDPDFQFRAPVESKYSVDYGKLLVDGNLWCHDYLSFFLPAGNLVYAPAPGVVAGIDPTQQGGSRIVVAHGDAVVSVLANLQDVPVEVGQAVEQGEMLGKVGALAGDRTGRLDWAVALNGYRIDPLQFASAP